MTDFKQDDNATPVLFRVSRAPTKFGADVTAVFPAEPANLHNSDMSCYAHVGQHSACSLGWYATTRPARPDEYADLKTELESAPYGYRLKVYQRMQPAHRDSLLAEQRRIQRTA